MDPRLREKCRSLQFSKQSAHFKTYSAILKAHNSLELIHPGHHLLVLLVGQVLVVPASVPRVKGVEADAVEALLRDLGPVVEQALVEVLVVSPGHGHLQVHSTFN